MNATIMNGQEVENRESVIRPAEKANDRYDVLMRRLLALLDATMRETWLPMGFRVLLVDEFPAMRKELSRKRSSLSSFEIKVGILAAEADSYRVFAGRSDAFVALRLLQNDLKALRSPARV